MYGYNVFCQKVHVFSWNSQKLCHSRSPIQSLINALLQTLHQLLHELTFHLLEPLFRRLFHLFIVRKIFSACKLVEPGGKSFGARSGGWWYPIRRRREVSGKGTRCRETFLYRDFLCFPAVSRQYHNRSHNLLFHLQTGLPCDLKASWPWSCEPKEWFLTPPTIVRKGDSAVWRPSFIRRYNRNKEFFFFVPTTFEKFTSGARTRFRSGVSTFGIHLAHNSLHFKFVCHDFTQKTGCQEKLRWGGPVSNVDLLRRFLQLSSQFRQPPAFSSPWVSVFSSMNDLHHFVTRWQYTSFHSRFVQVFDEYSLQFGYAK